MARMDLFKGDNARFLPNTTYKTKLSLGSGADMQEFAQFNKELLEWVRSEVKAGKSVDEIAAEYKVPAKYPGYVVLPPQLTKPAMQAVYDELKK